MFERYGEERAEKAEKGEAENPHTSGNFEILLFSPVWRLAGREPFIY